MMVAFGALAITRAMALSLLLASALACVARDHVNLIVLCASAFIAYCASVRIERSL